MLYVELEIELHILKSYGVLEHYQRSYSLTISIH
nr:MAG TPA: hypothetical protein [Caudoviricetes sp.]